LIWDSSTIPALSELLSQASLQISLTVRADTDAKDGGTVVNTARTISMDESGSLITDSDSAILTISEPVASINVQKTASTGVIVPGEELTYTITVSNDGEQDLTNITVIDTLPQGLTYASSNPDPDTVSHPGIIWEITNLPVGSSKEIRLTVRTSANLNDYDITTTNEVQVKATDESGDLQTDRATETLPLKEKETSIDIAKVASEGVIIPEEEITYTLTITNNGEQNLYNVSIYDTAPDGLKFVRSEYNQTTLSWTGNDILLSWAYSDTFAPGKREEIRITFIASREIADYNLSSPNDYVHNQAWVTSLDESNNPQTDIDAEALPLLPIVKITSPINDEVIRDTQTILARISKDVHTASISINGGPFIPMDKITPDSWDYLWDTLSPTLIDGAHTLQVKATDSEGYTGYSEIVTVNIDNTPEPIIILTPDSGTCIRRTEFIEVTAPDHTKHVTFEVSPDQGRTWYLLTDDRNPADGWNYLWDTLSDTLPDGDYQIKVTSYDILEKFIATDINHVCVDNSIVCPSIDITSITPLPAFKNDRWEVYVSQVIISDTDVDPTTELIWIENKIEVSPVLIPVDGKFSKLVNLLEGENTIIVHARDDLGNTCSDSVTITYVKPKVCYLVDKNGGLVVNPTGTHVEVPLNGVSDPVDICIRALSKEEQEELIPRKHCCSPLGVAHEFAPTGAAFNKPVTIRLNYTDDIWDFNRNGRWDEGELDETKFEIVYWDEQAQDWIFIGWTARDEQENWIEVQVNHFTIYDIAENSCAPPIELSVCVDKNPFKKNEGTKFCI
ncbi:DUF11 domain-containing protein, partial [bacterium]|nr:DUF11 domain-containing protein [bacterium]